ncbi:MAG: hypothetical protein CMJ65_13455 [Planctomycetaceae bacterium]|jgi:hypothetical protein|nr:hypothetical protein [Planctomycetaceae bacterium]
MPCSYDDDGVRFAYPDSWELAREEDTGEVRLTVSGDGTSFWSLTLFPSGPAAIEVVETAVDAFRDEYDELDVYCVEESLCGFPVEGRALEFVCLELINSAWLKGFETPGFTALVFYQGTDHELRQTRSVLEAITTSLQLLIPGGSPDPRDLADLD